MTLIAIVGDCTTTTMLALAATWPTSHEVIIVEADPRGGSLAGWLDVPLVPSLSTMVAAAHATPEDDDADLDSMMRATGTGVRFVPAPFRSREAARAVTEARRVLFHRLAARPDSVVMLDLGQPVPGTAVAELAPTADVIVICHRQEKASAAAATVRLERLREQVDSARAGIPMVIAVIGNEPFDCAEIGAHIDPDSTWVELAFDPLAASVHAGHRGVSARRMARLPLSRSTRRLADALLDATREIEEERRVDATHGGRDPVG